MRVALWGAVWAVVSAWAHVASAQTIQDVAFTSDPEDIIVTVRADHSLPRPSVRTAEGEVVVRYPETAGPASLKLEGDGEAVRQIDVRAGSNDTVSLRLALGDSRLINRHDVRIERRRRVCVIRVARDLLPQLADPSGAQEHAPAPAPPEPMAEADPPKLANPVHEVAAALPTADRPERFPVNTQSQESSSPVPVLLSITALLAIAYGVLQLLVKRKGPAAGVSPIEVVAQKRLGPRHQLLIVRAFGREHLLSVQGGTTTPIATNEVFDGDELLKRAPIEAAALERERTGRRSTPSSATLEEPSFGGELLKLAIAQRAMESRLKSPLPQAPQSQPAQEQDVDSQAVAGLVRLRKEAQL